MNTTGKIALFVGGTLFGSAGFKLLGSKDARKVYTHATAAVLRCKDQVMPKAINEARAAEEAKYIEDTAQA